MAKTQVRGEQILDQSVSLTADIKDTLAIANGGTGATSASAARTALGAQGTISAVSAFVATSESTASTSYADLTTTTDTVTVTVGSSGNVLVVLFANISGGAANMTNYMGFAVSGANTISAADAQAVMYQSYTAASQGSVGATFLITGLSAGSTTFKAKYRVIGSTGTFATRRIAVIPL